MADGRTLDQLLDRMEHALARIEELPTADRDGVFGLLDDVDHLHRLALTHLAAALPLDEVERLRDVHPSVAWLFEAYDIGLDARATAERAIDDVRPYIQSHGGEVRVLEVDGGRVHVRLSGACAGCTASAITLQEGVEKALRDRLPGFTGLTFEEDEAAPHPPPDGRLLPIHPR